MKSTTSDEASESSSFVSAASMNTSTDAGSQSEKAPPLPSTTRSRDASDQSSTSSGAQQQTPLARRPAATSPSRRIAHQESASSGYFALQPGTPGSGSRSPLVTKRPPASRSSHGIETKSGPPPALSTQRSYNADTPWRRLSPSETHSTDPQPTANGSIDSIVRAERDTSKDNLAQTRSEMGRNRRSVDGVHSLRVDPGHAEEDQDSTIRVSARHGQASSLEIRKQQNQEDLFLNLARSSPVAEGTSDSARAFERRRSRGNDFSQKPRPNSSGRPSSSGGRFFGPTPSFSYESSTLQRNPLERPSATNSLAALRADLNRDRPYAASAHPLEQRHRFQTSVTNPRLSFPTSRPDDDNRSVIYGRRRSIHNTYGNHTPTPLSEKQHTQSFDDGTESSVSTTAPSTVWDELDDLKARIRKIEITGNAVTKPNADALPHVRDRPFTASTSLTTTSMSPHRRKRASVSPEASTIHEAASEQSHNLLSSALARTKPVISRGLFHRLEAATTDALALSDMANGKSPYASAIPGTYPSIDRHLRRKADNMCRSLTELCIALAEDSGCESGKLALSVVASPTATVDVPQEPIRDPDLAASSRVLSRLEARRSSLRNGGSSSPQSLASSPKSDMPQYSPDLTRSNTLDRSRKPVQTRADDEISKDKEKPLSRAATDAGNYRSSTLARLSREYTSKHPLPNSPAGSASPHASALPQRSFFSSNKSTVSSVTSSSRPPSLTNPNSEKSRLADARQRRLASLGHYGSSPSAHASSKRLQLVGIEDG